MGEVVRFMARQVTSVPAHRIKGARSHWGRFGRHRGKAASEAFRADARHVRDIIALYAPVVVPPGPCRSHFLSAYDLMESLAIYCLMVELGYRRDDLILLMGRGKNIIADRIARIEALRDRYSFIERICARVREAGHVLI